MRQLRVCGVRILTYQYAAAATINYNHPTTLPHNTKRRNVADKLDNNRPFCNPLFARDCDQLERYHAKALRTLHQSREANEQDRPTVRSQCTRSSPSPCILVHMPPAPSLSNLTRYIYALTSFTIHIICAGIEFQIQKRYPAAGDGTRVNLEPPEAAGGGVDGDGNYDSDDEDAMLQRALLLSQQVDSQQVEFKFPTEVRVCVRARVYYCYADATFLLLLFFPAPLAPPVPAKIFFFQAS